MAQKELKEFIDKAGQLYLSHLSLDCVVFGFHDSQRKVLLLKMKNADRWSLPGGFVKPEESMESAAIRVLKERTGLERVFLRQFHVFSDPGRSDNEEKIAHLNAAGITVASGHWFLQRFLSVGFYALVDLSTVTPQPDAFSDACAWWDIGEIGRLILDHSQILFKALEILRLQLRYQPVGYNLLPAKFTMPELQKLYETILGRKLDRRNFHRKILSFGILRPLKEKRQGVAHKAPQLYSFDIAKYQKALKEGLGGI
jgi:ADP-ribose pyrophosphatase YjhB (NUDIX family)